MENIKFYWYIIKQKIKHIIINKHYYMPPKNMDELIKNNKPSIKLTCKWCMTFTYLPTNMIKKTLIIGEI